LEEVEDGEKMPRKESSVHEVHAKIWRWVLYFILFFGSGYLPQQHLQAPDGH
jgi:hypothetical protein